MRAIRLREYGPPDRLLLEQIPEPALQTDTDVRVAVRAASINPIDWKIRAGKQRGMLRLSLPRTLGLDVAGEVIEVGPGVRRFSVGDPVFGCPDWRRDGSYAEQCVLDESLLARKPDALSFLEAAAIPLAGLTAWQCLLPRLAERTGQRVLIQAGAGGVGHLAIQIAKHHGAVVAATCSERNRAFVEGLGCDRVVDYQRESWWEAFPEPDLILDALGGEARDQALAHVARKGRVASIVSGVPENTEAWGPTLGALATFLGVGRFWLRGRLRGIDAATVIKRTRAGELESLGRLCDAGQLGVHIDRTFPLEALPEAHAYGETGRIRGKVVIEVS